jgi:hypothetical protein
MINMKINVKTRPSLSWFILGLLHLVWTPLAFAAEFRFPIGLTYSSGIKDVGDAIEANHPVQVDTLIPVGLSIHPYVEFGHGFAVGGSVGPVAVGLGDFTFFTAPVGLDARYTFFHDKKFSPYLRAGGRYTFAGGDFLSTGDPGFFGAVGIEFYRKNSVSYSLEVGYDSSEIEVDAGVGGPRRNIKPNEWMVSFSLVF